MKQKILNLLNKKLVRFKGLHENEACYIFGDGPSIKWFDLTKFNNYPSICVNMIPFHKDFLKLQVRYVIWAEPWIFVPKLVQPKSYHTFCGIFSEYKKVISFCPQKEFFISLSNWPFFCGRNINYLFRSLPFPKTEADKMLSHFNCFGGSFYAALSLAYYMGFKTIYLVGFDMWTIQPSLNSHWYELGEGKEFEANNFATNFLEVLKSTINIFTITHEGGSKNVQALSYKNHTGLLPEFKENSELLSQYYLDVLASFPGYKIKK